MENDTIELLKKCDAGAKMGISSIDEILEGVCDTNLKKMLQESKHQHKNLCSEIHSQLSQHQSMEEEPDPMAKGMSWLKTNLKMTMNHSDETIADLITDGCNMGVKSLHKYLNQYKNADESSQKLCRQLSSIEEQLCQQMRSYL
ncbi:MAG: hypothetical protein IJF03_02560 [Lachnospiraceae bacterium]|jgi:phosphoglycerate-specific signal transduction histidine kinase|nr:hypothetical protein [Lachnospiraceae bacterium]